MFTTMRLSQPAAWSSCLYLATHLLVPPVSANISVLNSSGALLRVFRARVHVQFGFEVLHLLFCVSNFLASVQIILFLVFTLFAFYFFTSVWFSDPVFTLCSFFRFPLCTFGSHCNPLEDTSNFKVRIVWTANPDIPCLPKKTQLSTRNNR